MTLFDLADVLGKDIIIRRYPNQKGRFVAEFDHCETQEYKGSGVLRSDYGNGESPIEALNDYASNIKGKNLVFNAMSESRSEFVCPETITSLEEI
jgi:uncharacterized Fe-S cluster-containing MiaB family protein